MTTVSNATKKKAKLIAYTRIFIPRHLTLPYPLDRSTAGPGSGSLSIALTFDNKNIKLAVSQDQNESFSLEKGNGHFHILKGENIFLENVEIKPILFHAPGQAFINIENRCIYNCAFCNLADTEKGFLQSYDEQRFVDLILKTAHRPDFKAVALTSGVYPNTNTITHKMCYIVKHIRKKLADIPIGIEPCISNKKEIVSLKRAGADEIKINLQIPDPHLFQKICPHLDYDHIVTMLDEAVEIFGKGNVASNILFGLGEDDTAVVQTVEKLAEIGVVSTLRKVRRNKFNKRKIEEVLTSDIPKTSAERIITLALQQKKILKKNGLTTKTFETMCHKCGCCDIVPFWDV